jgi:branched-chain amino acid transport system permease protein
VGLLTIVTAGLNVLVGFTGQTSLGHAGLYAFGAYTAALCVTRAGTSEWVAIAAAVVVTSIVGAAVAAAALRNVGQPRPAQAPATCERTNQVPPRQISWRAPHTS